MRSLFAPLAFATILATSSLSFAAAAVQHSSGTVKDLDTKAMVLTMADGQMYKLPAAFKNHGIKDGSHVSITWEKSGLDNVARNVSLIK